MHNEASLYKQEYTVSEISKHIQSVIEINFDHVVLRGEISGLKIATSGHIYFTLKDEHAVLSAICWKAAAQNLSIKPEEGLEVKVTGRITTYPMRSNYQIIITKMEPYGQGALLQLLEKRKQQLAKEGLFDPSIKKPIPKFPQTIGVITSPTGAVIHDILHRIKERFPTHILLIPTSVQGDEAAGQIRQAVEFFGKLDQDAAYPRPDVLIIARGGGSLEDLWCFNDEDLVRAIAASPIPIITAVGHETDTTLVDYAASKRAPTPTAAAEMITPVREELMNALIIKKSTLIQHQQQRLSAAHDKLINLSLRLPTPRYKLEQYMQRLDLASMKLQVKDFLEQRKQRLNLTKVRLVSPEKRLDGLNKELEQLYSFLRHPLSLIKRKQENLNNMLGVLNALSHQRILEKGYTMITDNQGKPITRKKDLPNHVFSLNFVDGVQRVIKYPQPPKKKQSDDQQPDLFQT